MHSIFSMSSWQSILLYTCHGVFHSMCYNHSPHVLCRMTYYTFLKTDKNQIIHFLIGIMRPLIFEATFCFVSYKDPTCEEIMTQRSSECKKETWGTQLPRRLPMMPFTSWHPYPCVISSTWVSVGPVTSSNQ